MKYLLSIGLLLFGFSVLAQQNGKNKERILEYKKQYIIESLALSEADKKGFMNVYDNYLQDKAAKHKEIQLLKRGFIAKSDAQLKKDITRMLDIQGELVTLEKSYMDKFLKVITVRQLAALYAAERSFKKELIRKFEGNRGNQGGNRGGRGNGQIRRNNGNGWK